MSDRARRPLVAGNWKMFKTTNEARTLVRELRSLPMPSAVDVVIAPPFTALAAAADELGGSHIALGAQNMNDRDEGAFTGEISAAMLVDLGVRYVILGHSERRQYNNETDIGVNRKVHAALRGGLVPIVAVGETLEEHDLGMAVDRVVAQTRLAFEDVTETDVARCAVAYEPIWAIGSGKSDTPAGANGVIAAIRGCVKGLEAARILYGGSMKPENAAALLEQPDIDGGLIGGASLSAISFAAIVEAAASRVAA